MNFAPATIIGSTWWDSIFSARTLGLMLWVGLGVLTVSLLILMRTRWGQAKPLSKCVALSVFAHILLAGYAYGTRLIFDPPPSADRSVIKLSIVEPGQQTSRPAKEKRASPPLGTVRLGSDHRADVDATRAAEE